MRWPTRILGLPRSALAALARFVRARAGVERLPEPAPVPTPPTRPGNSRRESIIPGPPPVPSRHPTPQLRRRPPAKRPQSPDPRGRK